MAPPLDFNATLAEQLRDAGMQMRAMSKPQKNRQKREEGSDAALVQEADTTAPVVDKEQSAQNEKSGQNGQTARAHAASADADADAGAAVSDTASDSASAPAAPTATPAPAPTAFSAASDTVSGVASSAASETATPAVTNNRDANVTEHGTRGETATQHAESSHTHSHDTSSTPDNTNDSASGNSRDGLRDSQETRAETVRVTDSTTAQAAVMQPATVDGTAHATPSATVAATVLHTAAQAADAAATEAASGAATPADGQTAVQAAAQGAAQGAVQTAGSHTAHAAEQGAAHLAGMTATLPDAASELWAMSHHSAAPTLSERSWTGGVRGAVLDALRGLAGGRDHVLVNLKRLATHTGISYGSVRNAMSRLTRSGDIRTRQIRMADGHGVRVDFLTLPGQEGTGYASGPSGISAGVPVPQAAAVTAPPSAQPQLQAQPQIMTPHQMGQMAQPHMTPYVTSPVTSPMTGHVMGLVTGMTNSPQGSQQGSPQAYAVPVPPQPPQSPQSPQTPHEYMQGMSAPAAAPMTPHAVMDTAALTAAETGGPYSPQMTHGAAASFAAGETPYVTASMQQNAIPQPPAAAGRPAPSFWDTDDSLFALAWPHVAAAGLRMDGLRGLASIFALQGFDVTVLPRCLRYLDWELEQEAATAALAQDVSVMDTGGEAASLPPLPPMTEAGRQKAQAFVRGMQRRGTWPRPAGYEGED